MTDHYRPPSPRATTAEPVLRATGLVKTFGRVVGLDGVDLELYPGEVLAVIGDNGAGKSTLIKCLSGAMSPNRGEINLDGQPVNFRSPQDARAHGIETVYQTLAVAPALDIASNLFLGREIRRAGVLGSVFRMLDGAGMRKAGQGADDDAGHRHAAEHGRRPSRPSPAGSVRRSRWPAPRRSAARSSSSTSRRRRSASRSPNQVMKLIESIRDRGLPVILISHNMPQVFEVADRIHIQRLGSAQPSSRRRRSASPTPSP